MQLLSARTPPPHTHTHRNTHTHTTNTQYSTRNAPPPAAFLSFLGASKSNPVNGVLLSTPGDKPSVAIAVELHDGKYSGGQITWVGRPLMASQVKALNGIGTPFATKHAVLKAGQRVELDSPSLFLDGPAVTQKLSMRAVAAAFDQGGDKVDMAAAAASQPVKTVRAGNQADELHELSLGGSRTAWGSHATGGGDEGMHGR